MAFRRFFTLLTMALPDGVYLACRNGVEGIFAVMVCCWLYRPLLARDLRTAGAKGFLLRTLAVAALLFAAGAAGTLLLMGLGQSGETQNQLLVEEQLGLFPMIDALATLSFPLRSFPAFSGGWFWAGPMKRPGTWPLSSVPMG